MSTPDINAAKRLELLRWVSHGLLVAGFFLMMLDIRFEHKTVLLEEKIAWVPILYSMAMLILIPLGVFIWKKGGRYVLLLCYLGAMLVGLTGIYFHSGGHLIERLQIVLNAWQILDIKALGNETFTPPVLAPFSFLGLGSIGLFFTLSEKFRQRDEQIQE